MRTHELDMIVQISQETWKEEDPLTSSCIPYKYIANPQETWPESWSEQDLVMCMQMMML